MCVTHCRLQRSQDSCAMHSHPYFPKLEAIYAGAIPAAEAVSRGCLPPFKPGPAQDSVRDGSRLAGCSRKQCILPPISSEQEAIYVEVLLYFPKVALYFPKPAATYTGASFVMPSRQQGCAVVLIPRAGSIVASRVEIHEMAGWLAPQVLGPTFYARVVWIARSTNTAIWSSSFKGVDPIGPCAPGRSCNHGLWKLRR